MTEQISPQLKVQALQKIQLLKNSFKPQQCFYDMIQQPSEYESTMIAYQNLSFQSMNSILSSMVVLKQYHTVRSLEFSMILVNCTLKYQLCRYNQLKKIFQTKITEVKSKIRKRLILLIVLVLCTLSSISGYIKQDAYSKLFQFCDRSHSHIHQDFLLNTVFMEYPTDFALEHLACNRNTFLSFLIGYATIIMKIWFYLKPYMCIFVHFANYYSIKYHFFRLVDFINVKQKGEEQMNSVQRDFRQAGQQPLRIIT